MRNWHSQVKKILDRTEASGEELPNQQFLSFSSIFSKKTILSLLVTFIALLYCDNAFRWFAKIMKSGKPHSYSMAFLWAANPLKVIVKPEDIFMLLMTSSLLVLYLKYRASGRTANGGKIAYGQKGDSRFTTLSEIKQQYKPIPESKARFKGYGGFPISHLKHTYYIDDEPTHNIIVGPSRSRKTVQVIIPMIDNLSRAEKQSSLVINDPKKELYTASADILRKRGYDVYLLNLADPMNSMSYNPLDLALEKWAEGKISTAIQLINSISYQLFHVNNAGANDWVYRGAISAANANISEMIRFCLNPANFNDHKKHPEKVTMNNLAKQIGQLQGLKFYKEVGDSVEEHSVIDDYFTSLPEDNYARQQYYVIESTPKRSRNSIYSQVNQGLDMFTLPENAALTSMNSVNLRSIGFPKYVKFQLDEMLDGQRIVLRFRTQIKDGQSNIIKEYPVVVGGKGFVDYNFDVNLESNDLVEICYTKDGHVSHTLFSVELASNPVKQNDHYASIKILHDDLKIKNVRLYYSTKPTAIFVSAPDYDESNNAIYPIFIEQLYGELGRQCSNVAGGKTTLRVQFIWDEFGNMPLINNMENIMTVAAGRNILFTLALQSYQQLYSHYGNAKGAIIKDNGQNQKLLKCTDMRTNEDFSKAAGQRTLEANSISNNNSWRDHSSSYSTHAEAVPLITASRLSQMLAGEELILRAVHRFDNVGKRVRPYPIFNHGKTLMPASYTFLSDFDTQKDPNLVQVNDCLHKNINLKEQQINLADFLKTAASQEAVEAYEDSNKRSAKNQNSANLGKVENAGENEKMTNYDDYDDSVLNLLAEEPLTDEHEQERASSAFASLLMDFRGKEVDFALANKILEAFYQHDLSKVKVGINSIDNDEIREMLESELKKEDY